MSTEDRPINISEELYRRALSSIDAAYRRVSRRPRAGTANARALDAIVTLGGEADSHQIGDIIGETSFDASTILHGLMRRGFVEIAGERQRAKRKPCKIWKLAATQPA